MISRISSVLSYLRVAPFDVQTAEGRATERYRLAAWSVLANIVSKALGMFVMLLSVGLTFPYLGTERFGIWMTIASFAGMLSFLDLGVGNALINRIARAAASDNTGELRQAISGGLGFLLLLAIIVGAILVVIASALPWQTLIKLSDMSLAEETRAAVILFAVLFGLNIFSSGIHRILAGMQRAFEAHVVSAIGYALSAVLLVVLSRNHAGISLLLMATFGIQSIVPLILLIALGSRQLFVSINLIGAIRAESKVLLNVGGLFLLLQIGTMIGWGADSLIIASSLGAANVAVYSVTQRLFQFISQPLSMINGPLWGAYADAHTRQDKKFIQATLKKSMLGTVAIGLAGSLVLIGLSSRLIEFWTSGNVEVDNKFVLVFALWTVLEVTGNAFAMFLNGCGVIRPQVLVVITFCFLTLPLKLLFVSNAGLIGLMSVTIGVYLIVVVGGYSMIFRSEIYEHLEQNDS